MSTDIKPDHVLAAEELESYFARRAGWQNLKPTMPYARPIVDSEQWEHRLWLLHLNGETFEYKTGIGIKKAPTAAQIIASYCRDYLDARDYDGFEDWAGNFGYDSDSRKAETIYRKCLAIGPKLGNAGLARDEIKKLAELSRRL